ncbi:MAG: class I SAM-dependent methyltransferase [Planctomycetota bacterium]
MPSHVCAKCLANCHCYRSHPIDHRLKTVADAIESVAGPHWTVCDIGSDHGYLLKSLLTDAVIARGIAVENKPTPLQNSTRSLAGLNAEVRSGDGLQPVAEDECDGLSICGMGGKSIISILSKYPLRVPGWLFLQPNKDVEEVREWTFQNGFFLCQEFLTTKLFTILVYRNDRRMRSQLPETMGDVALSAQTTSLSLDPAYESLDRRAAFLFGPHLLRRRDPTLFARLREEHDYLKQLARRTAKSQARYEAIGRVLDFDFSE